MMLRRIHWVFIDLLLVSFACALAYLLRFLPEQFAPVPSFEYPLYIRQAMWVLPILAVLRIWLFKFFSLYRGISRYAGMHELIQIVMATTVGTTTLALWDMAWFFPGKMALFDIPSRIPIGVIVVDWMACIVLVGGARMFPRFLELSRIGRSGSIRNVIVVGAGEVGEIVVRNFLQNPQMGYRPVGFLDDDDHLWHHQIHGLEVFGPVDHLPECIQKYDITDVLVAVPKPSLRFMNHIVEICERAHVDFKIVPAMSDLMEKRVSITQIRNVEIEDLLGREPADIGLPDDRNYLQDEVVLVTGAGGSIGSELCRQIMQSKPRQLLMLDHGENNLYELAIELHYDFREKNLEILVADIQDVERMEKIFADYKPTVVFHAAAHKHVPLMELHPSEAVKNNIVGTFNVAFIANHHKVKRFILISTDKAVRPTSVMGASKRIGEMILAAMSRESITDFITVRFGNVLGSSGSVVPLFRRQIKAGGPVTVTHPKVERYFMTIPEAVNLVLQAGALAGNGQLLLLDMGEPVKIVDLARRMIALSGYEPNVDIDIQFTGLRPGEKLTEELLTQDENLSPTEHPQIFATRVEKPTLDDVKDWLRRLDALAVTSEEDEIIQELKRIVPEYQPQNPITHAKSEIDKA